MRGKVQAWGNSLGLRISKAYATELGLQAGTDTKLAALLSQIKDANQHRETNWGEPLGEEMQLL